MTDLMENIKNLRDITGAGFLDCKKALNENDNNIEKSIDHLRKKGLAKAGKKSSREAKEGAVGIFFNEKLFTIVQINTETDFAAKNDVFLDFMDQIGAYSLDVKNSNSSLEEFKDMIFDGTSIDDQFKNIISKIGENIILTKYISLNVDDGMLISSYIHNSYRKNIGKIAVIIRSKVHTNNDESKKLGKNLCMHIAASKPLAISIDKLDEILVSKEKEIQIESIKSSGKPDNIVEKILEGKMQKLYSESTFYDQQYILDSDKKVKQIISDFSKNNKFEVIDYQLVVLGS